MHIKLHEQYTTQYTQQRAKKPLYIEEYYYLLKVKESDLLLYLKDAPPVWFIHKETQVQCFSQNASSSTPLSYEV